MVCVIKAEAQIVEAHKLFIQTRADLDSGFLLSAGSTRANRLLNCLARALGDF